MTRRKRVTFLSWVMTVTWKQSREVLLAVLGAIMVVRETWWGDRDIRIPVLILGATFMGIPPAQWLDSLRGLSGPRDDPPSEETGPEEQP